MNKFITACKAHATSLVMAVLVITLVFLGLKLNETQKRLAALEKGTNESFTEQQNQLDNLSTSVDGVKTEMREGFAEQQKQLDSQQEQINQTKSVQSNTISALTRLRKQKDELEKKLEEGLELRRQKLAQMRAWASGGSTSNSRNWSALGGVFELTAYEWTGNPCANGEYPIPGYTVASNWFPIGTRIYIEGIGERVVTDTGGMSNNVIDIYMGDPETCYQFGRQTAEVYVIED